MHVRPGGEGGYCHIWAIQVCAAVKHSLLWDGVYQSENLGLEEGIIFHLN